MQGGGRLQRVRVGINERRNQDQVQNSHRGPASTIENIIQKGGGVFEKGIASVQTLMET